MMIKIELGYNKNDILSSFFTRKARVSPLYEGEMRILTVGAQESSLKNNYNFIMIIVPTILFLNKYNIPYCSLQIQRPHRTEAPV